MRFETAVPQKKLLQTERFAYQDFSPRKSLKEQGKKSHLMFWCFVVLTIKWPKLITRNTGFIIATTGRAHALMELCEVGILHALCSFESGWDVFVTLCVSSTEHRLSEQAGRVAGESWETAQPLICLVAPSTRMEFPCKDPLLRKCSIQVWKTILSACNEFL